MKKYYIEIEFKTNWDTKYWFPLFINANDSTQAASNVKGVVDGLNEHYEVTRWTIPRAYIDGISSQYIDEYIEKRSIGKLALLEYHVWRFKDFLPVPNLNFGQHLSLIDLKSAIDKSTIATTIASGVFPVRQYSPATQQDFDDFLLINIVEHSNQI